MTLTPTRALEEARERRKPARTPAQTPAARPPGWARTVLTLQRQAGNAAVSALLAAKAASPPEAAMATIEAALPEAKKERPDLDVLERGLKSAKASGVAVDLDGAEHKPPASALAVTKTGFGPRAVAPKKPVPPPKATPAKSPLARAGRPVGSVGGGNGMPASSPMPAPGPTLVSAGPVDLLAPPAPPTRLDPHADPAFGAVTGAARGFASAKKAHPPGAAKAQEAQGAALGPSDDVASQAKAAKVGSMDAQPAGTFDKQAFISAVKSAIEAKSPKTLEEADENKKSGQAGQVKSEVSGLVGAGTKQQGAAIETATSAAPDPSTATPKQVTAMAPEQPGPTTTIPAEGAAPKAASPDQLNLAAGQHQANQELADNGVSQSQLASSNEPEFAGALSAKQDAVAHAESGPKAFRAVEAATIGDAKAGASTQTQGAVAGMQASKVAALAHVTGQKSSTKSKDESKRAEVSAHVQSLFAATETEVKKILDGVDAKVDRAFDEGEKGARAQFETFVAQKMAAYKDDRYSGWLGGYRWLRDKVVGMPAKVNEFFEAGREVYLQAMDKVITRVADIVGGDLTAAKQRIAKGKTDIAAYVKTLGPELAKVGAEAAEKAGDQFGKLESDVEEKQSGLVDSLATRYVEARKGLDDRIEQLQEENKGLVDKAIGAIKAVVETILKLKDMLLGVLARAAAAIGKIIADPIGFLGNFVNAVKTGIVNFGTNILDHLKKGLQQWLFGALAEGGVELPEKWDLKGVVQLVLSILGLTWQRVRARIVARIGERAMSAVETGLDIIKTLVTEGIGGLWKWVLEKAGDIKETVMTQVQEMVVTQIVKAGITWLISMLNPAGAFIKACKMIYDVVMFFVERAAQIKEFVDAVLDSVESIASGGVGAVADKIEQTLAKLVPVLIGFLASLLGLGGIADKIKKILDTIQKPITQVVDWVVGKAVAFGKRLGGAAKRLGGKIKAGAGRVRDSVATRLGRRRERPPVEMDKGRLAETAAREGYRALSKGVHPSQVKAVLGGVLRRFQPQGPHALELVQAGKAMKVQASGSPTRIYQDGMWVTISPLLVREISAGEQNRGQGLSVEDVTHDRRTTSRGHFIYDGRGHEFESMVSGQRTAYRRDATLSAQGAHAEEQLVNAYEHMYDHMLQSPAARGGADRPRRKYTLSLGIDVSVSSCPQCATHIARFVKRLRQDGQEVTATVRFAKIYHGPSGGEVLLPEPQHNMDLVKLFYGGSELRATTVPRMHGPRGSLPRDAPGLAIPSGKTEVGKTGLAILRAAGVSVTVLEPEEIRGSRTTKQAAHLAQSSEKLRLAIAEVEKKVPAESVVKA